MRKIAVTVLIISFSVVSGRLALAKDKKEGKVSAAEIKVQAEVKEQETAVDGKKENPSETKEAANEAVQEVKEAKKEVDEAALEQARKKRDADLKKAKEKLSRQPEWIIYMTSLADRKQMGSDVLTFSEGKVTAKEFLAKGYQQSNCTVTTQEDGTIVWETMQANEKGDILFWRGELKDNFMQGMISMQAKDSKNQDIAFTTVAPKGTEQKIEPEKNKEMKETAKNKKDKGKK